MMFSVISFVTPSELESLEIFTDVKGCSAEVVEIPVADLIFRKLCRKKERDKKKKWKRKCMT
ncbi:hypothetical protein HUJ04_003153 [Dendroctonus ponderosae]|nr:hypothetical protein HUJ04_003153 [Dendroctonus ponderosae]